MSGSQDSNIVGHTQDQHWKVQTWEEFAGGWLEPKIVTFEAMVVDVKVTQQAEFNWPTAHVGSMGITFHIDFWGEWSNLIGSSDLTLLWIKTLV
jgi:hypothetical protein